MVLGWTRRVGGHRGDSRGDSRGDYRVRLCALQLLLGVQVGDLAGRQVQLEVY